MVSLARIPRLELEDAEHKALSALAKEEFATFAYWATIWVHLNDLNPHKRNNPFRKIVLLAQSINEARAANGGTSWPH